MGHSPGVSRISAQDHRIQRFRSIERRWKAGHRGMMDRSWWRTWTRPRTSFLVAVTFAAVLLPLDWTFWDDTPFFGSVRFIPAGFFKGFVIALFLVNGLMVELLLAWKTRDDLEIEPGARLLRFLLGSLPLLGFYAINFWQGILTRRPRWAVLETARTPASVRRSSAGPSSAGLYRAAAQALARNRAFSLSMLLWLYVGNALFLIALSAKLSELRLLGVAVFGGYVFQVALHVVVCCCLVDHLRDYVRRHAVFGWQRVFVSLLPGLALPLPFPLALASVGAVAAFETGNARQRTLCWATLLHGNGIQRLAAWGHLQGVLDNSPDIVRHRLRTEGVGRSERPGRAGRRQTAVYRLKTFLLGIDALALGWLASRLAEKMPGWEGSISDVVAALTWGALVGAGLAFLLAVSRTLLRSLGSPRRPTVLDAHAYGSLLALGLILSATGLNVGVWLGQGKAQQAAHLVVLLVGLGVAVAGLATVLQAVLKKFDVHQEDRHDDGVWLLFFFAVMLASGLMAIDEDAARAGTTLAVVAALLSPLWHLALAAVFRESWHRRSCGRRSPLIMVTLGLPLGGLAVPYWIFMHHRYWTSREPAREETY